MRTTDLASFALNVLDRHRFRTAMLLLAMAIGVCSVVSLTALGEGARRYVLQEFAFLGSDILVILPGRQETTGGMPPVTGTALRDVTLDDARAIRRFVRSARDVAPLIVGSAEIRHGARAREIIVLGTSSRFVPIRGLSIATGSNLPEMDLDQAQPVALIGEKVRRELFGEQRAMGRWIRLADRRFRIIGTLEGRGDAFGLDLSDAIFVPVASAQQLFNVQGLFRVLVELKPGHDHDAAREEVLSLMKQRHQGEEDVTILSPDALLAGFQDVLRAMTLAVGAIAGISLLVAGILTMNIMLISVRRRTEEIGLLKALGASSTQVLQLFLFEAGVMAFAGALLGVIAGGLLIGAGRYWYPQVPFAAPWWVVMIAAGSAMLVGLLFAWLPAREAAGLAPVDALTRNR